MPRLPPLPSSDTTIIYLIRHAATANNLAKPPRLQGRSPHAELSPEGWEQAARTERLLAQIPLHAIFSSPLTRAIQTAETIARSHRLPVQHVDALQEVHVGNWEGRSWAEISETEPEAYQRFMEEPAKHGYSGGENVSQVLERIRPAFEDLGRSWLGKSIAVVAHNVINRVWLSQVVGISLNDARSINQDNTGISILRYRDNAMKLLSLNITSHLWS